MKLVLLIAVLLAFSIYAQTFVTAQESEYHDVIVIGAGISGLAAAKQLADERYDVVVLEAQNRVGGRILSDHYNNYALDLGASWIHGLDENPIADIAREHGLELIIFDDEESFVYFDSAGNRIDDTKMEEIEAVFDSFYDLYKEKSKEMTENGEDISLEDVVKEFSKDLSPEEKQYLDFGLVWNIEGDWAADASTLSVRSFEKMGYKMDGRETIFPAGYEQIINILAKDLDIRLQQSVEKIDYGKTELITISTNKKDFTAKYIITTIPLGVLKQYAEKDIDLFYPDLPEWKSNSINELEMGVLNKVYFVFENQFWDDIPWLVQLPEEKGQWVYFANLSPLTKEPVLLAFLSGDYGTKIESYVDDEKIVEEGLEILRKMYGKDNVPTPLYKKVTKWATNPYSYGSYSYTGVGATNAHYYDMSKPVENRLFFAGEATEVRYPATVHGAYMSGIREALRIQAVDQNYSSPLSQIQHGLLPEYVICEEDKSLVLKFDSSSSACIADSSKEEFQKRDWACKKDSDEILTKSENAALSCYTSLLTYDGYENDDEKNYED